MLFSIQFQNKEIRMLLLVLTFFSFAFLLVSLRFWFFHSPSFITFPHIFQSFAISSSLIVFIFSFFFAFHHRPPSLHSSPSIFFIWRLTRCVQIKKQHEIYVLFAIHNCSLFECHNHWGFRCANICVQLKSLNWIKKKILHIW